MNDSLITIAMPKGRIFGDACRLLRNAGFRLPETFETTRKLIFDLESEPFRFILAKPVDVPTYVEYGAADIGIAGKDVLLESGRDVYEMVDLGISKCHMAVAGLPKHQSRRPFLKIATKYPNIASDFYRKRGEQVDLIALNGSIELAPIVGLADAIVDIVSTGQTLKENGLIEYDRLLDVSSRLVVNPVSYRLKKGLIDQIVEKMIKATEGTKVGMD
ncbi:ATP phosphoribosyltransferase [Sporolactobacillus terrae]|uniref:ATP phosphoribosyltransferase n=1 Tax=Sporolactobacillus terrae TaxID=269673 RepID=A0A410DAC1_9BACL|nr:ATP phosphoribosyltransferase [Sporolactobacillus terrae]QAA23033.1 ATP phosphoribosyltransferase [Sporolactobacillus terrae]QAA26006.1 ATP phosphoribosyltransferase [Sporolactobacillus terrae]UAK15100.1 ATP phosphoribosyltransferase [Sporolactobacillus terrae]BBN99443.1 ATP phosphoribosyltransferase [Sporolactobacillus terrae]